MKAGVTVGFWEDGESEKAEILIHDFGCVDELRFGENRLDAVVNFSSVDIRRLLESIKEAESLRVDPDEGTISSIDHVMDRIDHADHDHTRLYLNVIAEMPIASCGSVRLEPNFEASSLHDASDE